jgi:hypothetical protein
MEIATNHYGTVKRMAAVWESKVGVRANNLRSSQIRSFKKIWLTCGSEYAIVTYVTRSDLKKKDKPMKVSKAVFESGLTTVEDVRKCLRSPDMYLNPVLYNLICSGIESGKLKNAPKLKQPSTLPRLLTIAHEAHLRLELFFSLEEQRYGHDPSTDHGNKRIKLWKKLCDIVHSDRERNGEQAALTRSGGASVSNDNVSDESEDESSEKPRINPKYY